MYNLIAEQHCGAVESESYTDEVEASVAFWALARRCAVVYMLEQRAERWVTLRWCYNRRRDE